MEEQPRAFVREVDGQFVFDDPDALAVMRAVEKHNCRNTLDANAERIQHFVRRAMELGRDDLVIVVANVDDQKGAILAEGLMPGHNWQQFRDQGQIPFARGLAERSGVQGFLDLIDKEAAEKLRGDAGLCVVVVDRGVADIFGQFPIEVKIDEPV